MKKLLWKWKTQNGKKERKKENEKADVKMTEKKCKERKH